MPKHRSLGDFNKWSKLPSGYLHSPERICLLTQSETDLFNRRYPGLGVLVFVFVDDFLVISDDEAATAECCRLYRGPTGGARSAAGPAQATRAGAGRG